MARNPNVDPDALEFLLKSIVTTCGGMEQKALTPSYGLKRIRRDAEDALNLLGTEMVLSTDEVS